MNYRPAIAFLTLAIMASPAMAHIGAGAANGVSAGFFHPLTGLDHVLVMAAIGIWAAALGGRAIWAVPAAFVAMMAVGAILGTQSASLPFTEAGIVFSVIAMGALIAFRINVPVAAGMAVAGGFALMHGQAHGAEMAAGANGVIYGLGFCIATALLHAAGIAFGLTVKPSLLRWTGAAVSAAGLALLAIG
jgi:urease accessory protein